MRAIILLVCFATSALAQGSTDVFLVPLRMEEGRPLFGLAINVTARAGYDNQPSFAPDKRSLFYTSIRGDGQADIYRVDLDGRSSAQVTSTPESEYSGTMIPGSERISVVRVERDSTQRLWSFALDGSDAKLVLPDVRPVGYHAWVDSVTVALFVLGNPNALVVADLGVGRIDTIARGIGRSLVPLRGTQAFSFVQHRPDGPAMLNLAARGPDGRWIAQALTELPPPSEYVAWLGPGLALTTQDAALLLWRQGDARGWTPVADLRAGRLSRIAVSDDLRWIAVVAEAP